MSSDKETILSALHTALEAISGVKLVKRLEAYSTELDRAPMPAIYYLDSIEKITRKNSSVAQAVMTLDMQVFIKLTPAGQSSFHATADLMQTAIINILQGLVNPETGQVVTLAEIKFEKNFPNDTLGALAIEADVAYVIPWGDFAGTL